MEVKMQLAQKVFLIAAVINLIASLVDTAWGEALWTGLAITWCLLAWGYEKEAMAWK